MMYQTILLFGAPGCGKGTQGKILGQIPGFYFLSCGDVFRGLDHRSKLGHIFLEYSSKGELVPDEFTVKLWQSHVDGLVQSKRFAPDRDVLVLDGIPRSVNQAKIMSDRLNVAKVFHLDCPNRAKLVDRLKRRALKDNRLDDANETIIRNRIAVYQSETRPVLKFYSRKIIVTVDGTCTPLDVARSILAHL
ncbi:MAG: nucleoside monophosphate kinase [Verrucomicrobiae bacterium]|nr:nucleoside monophosphate kinase [Verrucomicrobiae bacterium]